MDLPSKRAWLQYWERLFQQPSAVKDNDNCPIVTLVTLLVKSGRKMVDEQHPEMQGQSNAHFHMYMCAMAYHMLTVHGSAFVNYPDHEEEIAELLRLVNHVHTFANLVEDYGIEGAMMRMPGADSDSEEHTKLVRMVEYDLTQHDGAKPWYTQTQLN